MDGWWFCWYFLPSIHLIGPEYHFRNSFSYSKNGHWYCHWILFDRISTLSFANGSVFAFLALCNFFEFAGTDKKWELFSEVELYHSSRFQSLTTLIGTIEQYMLLMMSLLLLLLFSNCISLLFFHFCANRIPNLNIFWIHFE